MYRRLTVELTDQEFDLLAGLARLERRAPRDEGGVLLGALVRALAGQVGLTGTVEAGGVEGVPRTGAVDDVAIRDGEEPTPPEILALGEVLDAAIANVGS